MFCRTARTSAASAARQARGEEGFTLIEVTIVSALFLLVMGVVFSMLVSAQRAQAFESGRGQALDDMTVTMDRMTKDLRQATNVIGTPTASRIEITTYDNGVLQDVVYNASGTTLTRTEGGQLSIQQQGLASTDVFNYIPSTTTPQDVQISLVVAPPNLPSTTVTLDGEVHLRNFGS